MLIIGLIVRLLLASFTSQSYDFVHIYYSVTDFIRGVNPYDTYDFAYPPFMLYLFTAIGVIYFKTGLHLELLNLPPAARLQPYLTKTGLVSVTLMGFDIPPPIFTLLFKIPGIMADTLIAYMLFKTFKEKSIKLGLIAATLWYLNPLSVWMSSIHGSFDAVAILFALLSMFLLYRGNPTLSGFALGAGVLTKLYPAFILPIELSWSLKKGGSLKFIAGTASALLLILAPILALGPRSFFHTLFGTRASAIFVGGLNPWAVKYIIPQLETLIKNNSKPIFFILLTALTFSLFILCLSFWRNPQNEKMETLNYYCFTSIVASYILAPVIVQAQYALWAMPFMIINLLTLQRDEMHLLDVKLRLKDVLLRFYHKYDYFTYFQLYWIATLIFEIALQGPSILAPLYLKSELLGRVLSNATVYWVRDLNFMRSFIFFFTAIITTTAYLMTALRPFSRQKNSSSHHETHFT